MPIYEYLCSHCGKDQEILVRSGADAPVCHECGGKDLKRKISVFAVSGKAPEPAGCACAAGDAQFGGDGCCRRI